MQFYSLDDQGVDFRTIKQRNKNLIKNIFIFLLFIWTIWKKVKFCSAPPIGPNNIFQQQNKNILDEILVSFFFYCFKNPLPDKGSQSLLFKHHETLKRDGSFKIIFFLSLSVERLKGGGGLNTWRKFLQKLWFLFIVTNGLTKVGKKLWVSCTRQK